MFLFPSVFVRRVFVLHSKISSNFDADSVFNDSRGVLDFFNSSGLFPFRIFLYVLTFFHFEFFFLCLSLSFPISLLFYKRLWETYLLSKQIAPMMAKFSFAMQCGARNKSQYDELLLASSMCIWVEFAAIAIDLIRHLSRFLENYFLRLFLIVCALCFNSRFVCVTHCVADKRYANTKTFVLIF